MKLNPLLHHLPFPHHLPTDLRPLPISKTAPLRNSRPRVTFLTAQDIHDLDQDLCQPFHSQTPYDWGRFRNRHNTKKDPRPRWWINLRDPARLPRRQLLGDEAIRNLERRLPHARSISNL